MPTILHIKGSPRGPLSTSAAMAEAYIAARQASGADVVVETVDVWAEPLAPFDGEILAGKYSLLEGREQSQAQIDAWDEIRRRGEQLKACDTVVISSPMWNFGVPYRLKQWIDLVTQPGLTFGWSPERGYFGLVTGPNAVLCLASMGDYPPGTDAAKIDFLRPYLEWWCTFVGITDVQVAAQGNATGPQAAASREAGVGVAAGLR